MRIIRLPGQLAQRAAARKARAEYVARCRSEIVMLVQAVRNDPFQAAEESFRAAEEFMARSKLN